MPYRIKLTPTAHQELGKAPGHIRAQARDMLDRLAEDPRPPRAKELHDKPNIYRIWLAGTWRIAYRIEDDELLILVLRLRPKSAIDYESL